MSDQLPPPPRKSAPSGRPQLPMPPWRPAGGPPPPSRPAGPPPAAVPAERPWWTGEGGDEPTPPEESDESESPSRRAWVVPIATGVGGLVVGLLVGAIALGGKPAESEAMIIPAPAPTVTVTAQPRPAPTVKVTLPAPTVTVTVPSRSRRSEPDDPKPKNPAPPKPDPKPEPEPVPGGSFPGTGTFVVGEDIQPGTYKSKPTSGGYVEMCVWRRLKDTSGSSDSTIDSDLAQGPVRVTIKASDGAFETYGCVDWTRVN